MPPCEALTTTAPAASAPTRVMLSAMTIGLCSGGMDRFEGMSLPPSCRERQDVHKPGPLVLEC